MVDPTPRLTERAVGRARDGWEKTLAEERALSESDSDSSSEEEEQSELSDRVAGARPKAPTPRKSSRQGQGQGQGQGQRAEQGRGLRCPTRSQATWLSESAASIRVFRSGTDIPNHRPRRVCAFEAPSLGAAGVPGGGTPHLRGDRGQSKDESRRRAEDRRSNARSREEEEADGEQGKAQEEEEERRMKRRPRAGRTTRAAATKRSVRRRSARGCSRRPRRCPTGTETTGNVAECGVARAGGTPRR